MLAPGLASPMAEVQKEKDLHLAPKDGQDNETRRHGVGIIAAYPGGEEVQQRIAFTAKMVDLRPVANDFLFEKIFGDGDFVAAGLLLIPPKKSKPTKNTKDNTFIFYVMAGVVAVKIHRTSFEVARGGMFMAPRGNTYFIENISDRDAKIFFVQARKVVENQPEKDEVGSPRLVYPPEVYPEVPRDPGYQWERAESA